MMGMVTNLESILEYAVPHLDSFTNAANDSLWKVAVESGYSSSSVLCFYLYANQISSQKQNNALLPSLRAPDLEVAHTSRNVW